MGLRQHHLAAFDAVDGLGDVEVAGEGAEHVGSRGARLVRRQTWAIVSRTAWRAASSRSSSRPVPIRWVAVSANGSEQRRSLLVDQSRSRLPFSPLSRRMRCSVPSPFSFRGTVSLRRVIGLNQIS